MKILITPLLFLILSTGLRGETIWCAPYGPGHLANKINSMGILGFNKWRAENPGTWFLIKNSCGTFLDQEE